MAKTTIQITRRNLRLLEALKASMGARSYDEVIERLVTERTAIPDDMFGVDRGRVSRFTAEDRLEDRK